MFKNSLIRLFLVQSSKQTTIRKFLSSEATSEKFEKIFKTNIKVPDAHNAQISVINLNDASTRNALGKKSVYKILDILNELKDSTLTRTLILRSLVPNVFCAGANLKERLQMTRTQAEAWLKVQRSLMEALSDFPYPTIAAIDGHALGGGLELALACDLRIVNGKAKVGLVETSHAIIPGAGGTQRLSRLIGVGKAKELIFTADVIDGNEAARLGIANHSVDGGESASFDRAIELGLKICKRGPKALRLAKAAIDNGTQTSLDTGLDIELAYYGQLLDSADRAEGMKAFVEKRKPVYTGE